jgi:hypothetical protein
MMDLDVSDRVIFEDNTIMVRAGPGQAPFAFSTVNFSRWCY